MTRNQISRFRGSPRRAPRDTRHRDETHPKESNHENNQIPIRQEQKMTLIAEIERIATTREKEMNSKTLKK